MGCLGRGFGLPRPPRRPRTRKRLTCPGIFGGGEARNHILFLHKSDLSLDFDIFPPVFPVSYRISGREKWGKKFKNPQRWHFRVKIFTESATFGGDKPKNHILSSQKSDFPAKIDIFHPIFPVFYPTSGRDIRGKKFKTPQRRHFRVKILTESAIFGGDKPENHSLTGPKVDLPVQIDNVRPHTMGKTGLPRHGMRAIVPQIPVPSARKSPRKDSRTGYPQKRNNIIGRGPMGSIVGA